MNEQQHSNDIIFHAVHQQTNEPPNDFLNQQQMMDHGNVDIAAISQQPHGLFGFGIPPAGWGLGGGGNLHHADVAAQQQLHAGSPGPHSYHPQEVGMQTQPIMSQEQHSPLGLSLTPNSMDPLESILGPFPVAKLRGMPFEAALEDVLVFFQGLLILDVILGSNNGRGTGEAFVVFGNPIDFQMALQRNRQSMGRRYVSVFQSSRPDYYAAIVSQHQQQKISQQQHHHHHQKTRHVSHAGVEENTTSSNSMTGTSSSGLWSSKDPTPAQASAMQQNRKGGYSLHDGNNDRYIKKNRGGGHQMKPQRGNTASVNQNWPGNKESLSEVEHTGYLRMRGLPFTATVHDVVEFFEETKPIEESIVFSYRNDGRATGEGYLCFEDPEAAKSAMMSKNRKMMGSRYIELFVSSKEEHRRVSQRCHMH